MKEPITLDTIFLFDLDSTITSKEILPYIASIKGIEKELEKMTEETMKGLSERASSRGSTSCRISLWRKRLM